MKRTLILVTASALALLLATGVQHASPSSKTPLGMAHTVQNDNINGQEVPISGLTEIFEISTLNVEAAVTRFLEMVTWAPARKGGESEESASTLTAYETERKWNQL
jgi:hypothetical protein